MLRLVISVYAIVVLLSLFGGQIISIEGRVFAMIVSGNVWTEPLFEFVYVATITTVNFVNQYFIPINAVLIISIYSLLN